MHFTTSAWKRVKRFKDKENGQLLAMKQNDENIDDEADENICATYQSMLEDGQFRF